MEIKLKKKIFIWKK